MQRPLRRSRSSKVTDFGTNWKLIYDCLLMINTNLPPTLNRFHVMADYWSNFRPTLTLSLGWSPANIATYDIALKTRFSGLHFRCRKCWCIFNYFYVGLIRPKATEFGEITLRLELLRRSRSSKVTEFGTNRKLICNFLLLINNNLAPILHRFRDYSVR